MFALWASSSSHFFVDQSLRHELLKRVHWHCRILASIHRRTTSGSITIPEESEGKAKDTYLVSLCILLSLYSDSKIERILLELATEVDVFEDGYFRVLYHWYILWGLGCHKCRENHVNFNYPFSDHGDAMLNFLRLWVFQIFHQNFISSVGSLTKEKLR